MSGSTLNLKCKVQVKIEPGAQNNTSVIIAVVNVAKNDAGSLEHIRKAWSPRYHRVLTRAQVLVHHVMLDKAPLVYPVIDVQST